MVKATKTGQPLPDVDRELYENPQSALGAEVEHDDSGYVLKVDLEQGRILTFDKPGKRLPHKRLYTIKAMKPDGTVIQIPLEDQINNNVASSENAVGLMTAVRKDFVVFYDFGTRKAAFCPTWDCWAKWNDKFKGFCCDEHYQTTAPSDEAGGFGEGATTSKTWSM